MVVQRVFIVVLVVFIVGNYFGSLLSVFTVTVVIVIVIVIIVLL